MSQTGQPPRLEGYSALQEMGTGSTARVWRGLRNSDGMAVAIKVVDADFAREEIIREAAVLSSVRHPHLLHLYDVFAVPDSGAVALILQLAQGGSLAQIVHARDFLSLGETITLLVPLAQVLQELHSAGVTHADLSPANVLFLRDGKPMVSDAGLVSLTGSAASSEFGTDGVMAPEVIEGFAATPESDIYSLGCLAWLALVGEPPGWVGTRRPLTELVPRLPAPAVELIEWCLSPEPEDRPMADEVASAALALGVAKPIALAPAATPKTSLTRRIRGSGPQAFAESSGNTATAAPHHAAARHRQRCWRDSPCFLALVALGSIAAVLGVATMLLLGPANPESADAGSVADLTLSQQIEQPVAVAPSDPAPSHAAPSRLSARDEMLANDIQTLIDVRADAWNEVNVQLLPAAVVPGSPAFNSEEELLTRAAASDISYANVDFRVDDLEQVGAMGQPWVHSATGEEPPDLVLEVRVDVLTSEYSVQSATISTVEATTDRVNMQLINESGSGWRLIRWTAAT